MVAEMLLGMAPSMKMAVAVVGSQLAHDHRVMVVVLAVPIGLDWKDVVPALAAVPIEDVHMVPAVAAVEAADSRYTPSITLFINLLAMSYPTQVESISNRPVLLLVLLAF
jgi:hypothetical protein